MDRMEPYREAAIPKTWYYSYTNWRKDALARGASISSDGYGKFGQANAWLDGSLIGEWDGNVALEYAGWIYGI